jgi:sulfoxide reductase heme-binding subunit YedZ
MSRRFIIAVKLGVHLLCLAPLIWVVRFCISPRVFLNPDPVKFIIHFTGNWAIYLLLVSVSLLLVGNLTGKDFRPVQVSRITGLYAFFYPTLHVLTYFFIYSGYDFIAAFAGFHTGHAGVLLVQWNAILPGLLDDFRKRQFLGIGLLAWVLLFLGAVTSQRLLEHALHVKKWRYLYGFIYAAAIAAVIHFRGFVLQGVPARGGRCTGLYPTPSISASADSKQASHKPTWKRSPQPRE